MNKLTYDTLSKYEKQLHSAKVANFARLTMREFEEIASIYEREFNTKVTKSQRNCSHCKLKILKEVADMYYNYKPKNKNDKNA